MQHDQTTEPSESSGLVEALANMAEQWNDVQGEMMFGDKWPAMKEAKARAVEYHVAEAQRLAKLERLATLARRALIVYLSVAVVLIATALAVMAWKAAL